MGNSQWLWPSGPKLEQKKGVFPLGTDSVLLADFAGTGREKRICDIGCGTGVLSILLGYGAPKAQIDAIDISQEAAQLAQHNFEINSMSERARAICLDVRISDAVLKEGAYDLIICNPPYFAAGSGATANLATACGTGTSSNRRIFSSRAFMISASLGKKRNQHAGWDFSICRISRISRTEPITAMPISAASCAQDRPYSGQIMLSR